MGVRINGEINEIDSVFWRNMLLYLLQPAQGNLGVRSGDLPCLLPALVGDQMSIKLPPFPASTTSGDLSRVVSGALSKISDFTNEQIHKTKSLLSSVDAAGRLIRKSMGAARDAGLEDILARFELVGRFGERVSRSLAGEIQCLERSWSMLRFLTQLHEEGWGAAGISEESSLQVRATVPSRDQARPYR